MKKAIMAKKIGMTQVFANDGKLIPVTVVSRCQKFQFLKFSKEDIVSSKKLIDSYN